MECPEISAHIRELTVSVQVFCLNQGETVSDQDSVVCQNSGVSMTRDQISRKLKSSDLLSITFKVNH